MCVQSHFDQLFSALPPGMSITLTREQYAWIVEQAGPFGCDRSSPEPAADRAPARSVLPLLSVAELAIELGPAASTMRNLLAGGLFGGPEDLKANGKRYVVPRDLVEEVRRTAAAGLKLDQFCVLGTPSNRADDTTRKVPASPSGAEVTAPAAGDRAHPTQASGATREGRQPPADASARRPAGDRRKPRRREKSVVSSERRTDLGAWRAGT
jgi:hypothetical protein